MGPEFPLSFDASSPLGCCLQSHEVLLNKGMKYRDSGLNAPGLRTCITTVDIATGVIGWKPSRKETTWQTEFSTKFGAKMSLPWPFFSWMPSTNRRCCYVSCNYKYSRAESEYFIPLFNLKFHSWVWVFHTLI